MIASFDEVAKNVQELFRLDVQLKKQVQDMEDFELQSKQNRLRLLSGMNFDGMNFDGLI